MPDEPLSAGYWDQRYMEGNTGWDMGHVSPPLRDYFAQLPRKDLAILIPGCGNSYEARWLLENGFTNITLLDISAVLMDRLQETFGSTVQSDHVPRTSTSPGRTVGTHVTTPLNPITGGIHVGSPLNLITGDFFGHTGQYDLLIEQTFFCALDPARRPQYVDQAAQLLRPGGKLAGLLFDRSFTGGPPFGGDAQEYQNLLEKKFSIRTLAPCYNSIAPRAGTELFLIAEIQH